MSTLLSKLNSSLSLSRWIRIFKHHKIQSDNNKNDSDNNNGNGSNGYSSPVVPTLPAVECYACTQAGVPAFHSTTCDRTNTPEWEASAGSSLIPIRNKPPNSATARHESLNPYTQWIFGRVLDPRSKRVQRWNRAILLARAVALAVDPLFFYSLSIGRGGAPCLYMDGGLAVIVTVLRTCTDIVHVMHVWLQFRVAYVSRESLVVGCGKLVWDARMIAEHYVRSVKGFWFDVFVILPVPQSHLSEADKQKYSNVIRWMDYIQHKEDFGGSLAKIVVNKPGLEHFNIYVEKTGADLTSKKVSAASKDVAKSDKNINSVKGAAEVLEFKQRSSFFLGV